MKKFVVGRPGFTISIGLHILGSLGLLKIFHGLYVWGHKVGVTMSGVKGSRSTRLGITIVTSGNLVSKLIQIEKTPTNIKFKVTLKPLSEKVIHFDLVSDHVCFI